MPSATATITDVLGKSLLLALTRGQRDLDVYFGLGTCTIFRPKNSMIPIIAPK